MCYYVSLLAEMGGLANFLLELHRRSLHSSQVVGITGMVYNTRNSCLAFILEDSFLDIEIWIDTFFYFLHIQIIVLL
jgi:hypothetical protein